MKKALPLLPVLFLAVLGSSADAQAPAGSTCDQVPSGPLAHSALTSNWKVLASAKGGVAAFPKVKEPNQACVGGGITRGILYLAGDPSLTPADVEQLMHDVLDEMKNDRAVAYSPGKLVGGKWTGGGSSGTVVDFKRVKDKIAQRLYDQGRIPLIVTTVYQPDAGAKPSDVIKYIQTALAAGVAVEVDLDYGGGKGHFATVTEVVQTNDGQLGITIADDPTQADTTAAFEVRNTYIFPDGGDCYYWSRADGGKKTVVPGRRIRGVMLERKVGPKKGAK